MLVFLGSPRFNSWIVVVYSTQSTLDKHNLFEIGFSQLVLLRLELLGNEEHMVVVYGILIKQQPVLFAEFSDMQSRLKRREERIF